MHRIGYSGGIQLLVTSNPRFSVDINSIIDGKRNDDDDDIEYRYRDGKNIEVMKRLVYF